MGQQYKKFRRHNKVFELTDELRQAVDDMLMDTSITYDDISRWLVGEGHEISKSTIGRYALETRQLANRLIETQTRVRELMKVAKAHQDDEALTEGALQIAVGKLSEKIALIEEDLDDLPPEKAIDLMIKLSRAKAYKDKVYADLRGEYDLAHRRFKEAVNAELETSYPEIVEQLIRIADATFGKLGQQAV
ncbi:DUF3486 family protein [Mycobacterium gordonae]|nr:DUF3486 family protein [Mycobacterium gordonae]